MFQEPHYTDQEPTMLAFDFVSSLQMSKCSLHDDRDTGDLSHPVYFSILNIL